MTGKAKQYFEITRRGKLILADDKHHKPIFLVTEDRIPHIEATIGTIIKDDNGELWKAAPDGWCLESPHKPIPAREYMFEQQ